jgi:hypothetical protein
LSVNRKSFSARYFPKKDDFPDEERYEEAVREFDQKLVRIGEIIRAVPKEDRPHVWVSDDGDFGFDVPYTIFKCEKNDSKEN